MDAQALEQKNMNKLSEKEIAFLKAEIKSHHEHFEALNFKSAQKRVDRFKKGLIKELCNLRRPGDGISPYGNTIN
jgi:hypothetical protein